MITLEVWEYKDELYIISDLIIKKDIGQFTDTNSVARVILTKIQDTQNLVITELEVDAFNFWQYAKK